jgi:hypothetical protein
MRSVAPEPELSSLLERYDAAGGVLDYVFFAAHDIGPPPTFHRAAALAGMVEIDRRLEQRANRTASEEYPIEMFYRVRWDEAKLTGEGISFSSFWGTDDVEPKPIGDRAWSIPIVDGYKTAFFHPPHGLRGSAAENAKLFADLNRYVLGTDPQGAEIFSWSTDWSNYFDAGHEWWGALYWTIRPAGSQRMVVVGASTTD